MREKLEDLKSALRNLGYDEEEKRWDDFRTLDECKELTRGISDSIEVELEKLKTMQYEIQYNRKFTKLAELFQKMIEIKKAEQEGWEEILNVLNFLSY